MVCVDFVEVCANFRQTIGRSQSVGVFASRDLKLVSGLWAESNVRRRIFYRNFYVS